MSSLVPNPDALQAFMTNPDGGPVVMLNLLKFKPDGGAEAYGRYSAAVSKMVEARGGRILYAGRAQELLVGDESWDAIALVEYPSRKALIEMTLSPEYQAIHADREAGLERTVLYATKPLDLRSIGK